MCSVVLKMCTFWKQTKMFRYAWNSKRFHRIKILFCVNVIGNISQFRLSDKYVQNIFFGGQTDPKLCTKLSH